MTTRKRSNEITALAVAGYKSIVDEISIDIGPLTILSGANSSGKSSMFQPLLLLKQTLESSYDPGALLLNGPNVKFAQSADLFARTSDERVDHFSVGITIAGERSIKTVIGRGPTRRLDVVETTYWNPGSKPLRVSRDMSARDAQDHAPPTEIMDSLRKSTGVTRSPEWVVNQERCFLEGGWHISMGKRKDSPSFRFSTTGFQPFTAAIQSVIHLPGLRGNPERSYPVTAVAGPFPGTFETYTASILATWKTDKATGRLQQLTRSLSHLGLASRVSARRVSDTEIQIRVSRLPSNIPSRLGDMVNIADVGVGVSQTLPILVALVAAEPGQLVFVEQPEIHLHPRAQFALAEVLLEAVKRGVRVVVETHSSLLLLAIQALVAEQKLSPDSLKLHWFSRREDGATRVTSAEIDVVGAFGDWPEDFGITALKAQQRYLDAAEMRLFH